MAFTSGNLGKELLQNVFKHQRQKSRGLSDIKKHKGSDMNGLEAFERKGGERKIDESLDVTNLPFEKYVNEKYKCSCHICQEKKGIKSKSDVSQGIKKGKVVTLEGNEKGFSYLLSLLVPDRGNAPKGLRFLIADTLIFIAGEPRFLIYNSRDKYIRYIKNKDRLSLREMKKFFQNRKQRKELDGINFYNENTLTMSKKIKEAKLKIEAERIDDLSHSTPEKLSPTRKEKKKIVESSAHKEIVICKYTDESLQVLSELDFSYLMMKRKIEAVWMQTDYIQTYITLKKDHPYYIKVDFEYERDRKNPLYDRASNYVYYLAEEKEPEIQGFDYSTEEDRFEEELKGKNVYEYCQYITFKLVCYLDAYCATRVKEIITEFAWDETNLVYLTSANKIKFFNLDEIDDYILKEVAIVNDEEKQKVIDKLNDAKNSPYQGKVEILWAFKQYYEEVKREMGIHKDFDDSIIENTTSNEAFRQMNPEASFTLYDVMTNNKEFEKFKIWLQNRTEDPGTLARLYKSALKYVDAASNFGTTSTFRNTKASFIRQEKEKIPADDDSTKMFLRKLKALDICGNGFSRKRYIHSSEILYRSDVFSGRRLIAGEAAKTAKTLTNSSHTECSTAIKTPSLRSPIGMSSLNRFKIKSQKISTPQNILDQSGFSKSKSLTSILYLKSSTTLQ